MHRMFTSNQNRKFIINILKLEIKITYILKSGILSYFELQHLNFFLERCPVKLNDVFFWIDLD